MTKQDARQALSEHYETASKRSFKGNAYGERHVSALLASRDGHERGISLILRGLAAYADETVEAHGYEIGDDYVLGPYWKEILDGVMRLRDGHLGRLDAGLLGDLGTEELAKTAKVEPGFDPGAGAY